MLSIRNLKKEIAEYRALVRQERVEDFLSSLPKKPVFDFVVTSPPYDIGKPYERKVPLDAYVKWQAYVITEIVQRLSDRGSICWQVGNYIHNGEVRPLDIELAPIFYRLNLKLRNRIIWTFGHGMHAKKRFSGRYETILWFTKGDDYVFNLDDVRVPAKYPGKRYYKGNHRGELSGNPLGKNPEDVWYIPNIVGNHVEKTAHPCQFPVGLVQRLVLALTNKGDIVFDPFAGAASTAVAAMMCGRNFIGTEIDANYVNIARERIKRTLNGVEPFRPADKPVYDPAKSNLSRRPKEWN